MEMEAANIAAASGTRRRTETSSCLEFTLDFQRVLHLRCHCGVVRLRRGNVQQLGGHLPAGRATER